MHLAMYSQLITFREKLSWLPKLHEVFTLFVNHRKK